MLRTWVGSVFLVLLGATSAIAQAGHSPSDMAAMIDAKRMEVRHHTEQMQGITDSAELQREMQKHFTMVEELMGFMIAQQRMATAAAPAPMPMEGEMAMPAAGGQPVSASGAGMGGGMMGGEHGMGMGMGGAAQGMSGAPDAARRLAEREALLAEVTRHSQYIETLKDPEARTREILRHQQMLDRLLELMR